MVISFPRPRPPDNAAVVEGIRSGDPEAARFFYEKFGGIVNRLVWRILGPDQEHDDVVQEAMMAAVSSIGSLRDPERLDAWMTIVTVNTARQVIRRRKLFRLFHLVPEVPDDMDSNEDVEDRVFLKSLYTILNTMKADDRIVLVLRFMDGQELAEIALSTGWSLATVKRRLARAKEVFLKKARRDPILASAVTEDGSGG